MIIHEPGPGGQGGRSTRALSIMKLMKLDGLSALDLGSKEGYNSFDLADCGCRHVLGVEIRDDFLAIAEQQRKNLFIDNVEFRKGDARIIDELQIEPVDICLCSGLLYHMMDPVDLLCRIGRVCKVLALETHISPDWYDFPKVGKKYKIYLKLVPSFVRLHNKLFYGRYNIFPARQDMQTTSGSIDSHTTFWLSLSSLKKALAFSGFVLEALYYKQPPINYPEILVNYGVQRTKVFVLAKRN